MVKRKDLALLTCVVLIATSLCCLLLNLFVFSGSPWSLFIIGACLLLFVLVLPVVIYTKLPIYLSLALDGAAIAFYLYMITFNTKSDSWFTYLALPIVILVTILVEIFALLLHMFPVAFLTTALYFFIETALLCVGLELLIEHYLRCYRYSAAHHPVKKEASGSRAEKTAFLKKVVVSNCLYRQSIHIFPHSPCRSQAAFSEYSSRGSASFSEEYQKHSAAFCPYSALFPWYPGQAMP